MCFTLLSCIRLCLFPILHRAVETLRKRILLSTPRSAACDVARSRVTGCGARIFLAKQVSPLDGPKGAPPQKYARVQDAARITPLFHSSTSLYIITPLLTAHSSCLDFSFSQSNTQTERFRWVRGRPSSSRSVVRATIKLISPLAARWSTSPLAKSSRLTYKRSK